MDQTVSRMRGPGAEAEPDSVHRSITEGHLDVHPTLNAIVVNYQMDAVVVSKYGEPMVADRKDCRKLIKVQNLCPETDIQALAWHIVSKCELINVSRLPEVEQLLSYLQNRKDTDIQLESSSKQIQEQIKDLQSPTENATMSDLDSYLENLYDDLQSKIRGTGLILQLARLPDNLAFLIENESLFQALARVLKEDWKKSIELSTNIVYIFFCFSTFSVFHKLLAQHKIGFTCMTVLEHEIKRFKSLQDDLAQKKKDYIQGKSDDAGVAAKAKKEYDKAKKKYQLLLKKQETLLRVTLYLLLNLSEDTRVELKMRNKGLVSYLCTLLERSNQELLILVISFLKKLSIYTINKDEMVKYDIVKKLFKVIPCDNEILANVTLRLLLNLSFDPALRREMVKIGYLPRLSALLRDERHRVVVLCVLYHISMESKARSMFSYTDCIPEVMRLILECPDDLVDPETVALGINLSCSPRNVHIMCNGPGLKLLMRRALKSQDSLLLKMIRNISKCPGNTKKLFLPFLSELCQLLKDSGGEDEVCVEVLGILGNLSLPDVDFNKVVTDLDLLPFIMTKLQDPNVLDDLLLEVVILCGTFALDEKCAELLVNAGVPQHLITVLKAKQEDDEIVLQIVYLFHHLVLHESTRQQVTKQSLAPDYLLELMNDKNKEVCKICSKTLDIILECDPQLALKIKLERFRWHNFQWLEMMAGESFYQEGEESDDDYLDPHYLQTAAELYEMQNQLDASHGYQYPGEVEFELGHNFNPFDEEQKPPSRQPPHAHNPPEQTLGDPDEMLDTVGGVTGSLSPNQYTMLMKSMRDPLAMYNSSLATSDRDSLEVRPSSPSPSYGHFDPLDPMEGFGERTYNISPTYGHLDGRGHGAEGEGGEVHPMYAMMNPTHQPRPPTVPRNPQSRH